MKPITAEQLLSARAPGVPFEVRVEGKGVDSFLKPTRCGYFEWSYGERDEAGQLVSFSLGYSSPEPVTLVAGDERAEMPANRLRTYLAPTYEREYGPGELTAPDVVNQYLAEGHPKAWAGEYCLEVGRTYHAMVHEDSYSLPPEGPGEKPREVTRRVLWISDRPFADGKPQVEATPALRSFSY